MKTCENCIKKDVCSFKNRDCVCCEDCKLEHCVASNDYANFCEHFEDKSKYTKIIHGKWMNRANKNDYIWCECSNCGFMIENYKAVILGKSDTDYVGVKYNLCPICGADMRGDYNDKIDN